MFSFCYFFFICDTQIYTICCSACCRITTTQTQRYRSNEKWNKKTNEQTKQFHWSGGQLSDRLIDAICVFSERGILFCAARNKCYKQLSVNEHQICVICGVNGGTALRTSFCYELFDFEYFSSCDCLKTWRCWVILFRFGRAIDFVSIFLLP